MIFGLAGVAVSMSIVAYGFNEATYKITPEAAESLVETTEIEGLTPLIDVEYENDVAFKKAVADAIGDDGLRDHEAAILQSAMDANARLILIGILGFVASFALSLGPVMWVLLSEIFPVKVRALAISFVTIFNSGASWLVQFLFPWEVATFGIAGVFLSFAVFAVIGLVLVVLLLPETKGLTLERLEEKLRSGRSGQSTHA